MRDPFCDIPPATVLGWPKNLGHATSPHQAMMAKFAQRAAEVLALSATGEELTADLTVTEGHKHNSLKTLLAWRQLAAWPIIGRTLVAAVTPGQVITSTGGEDLGLYLFRMPLDADDERVTDIFYPRFRASVESANKLIVYGDLVYVDSGALTVISALPALNIGNAVTDYENRWFTWGPIEIDPGVPDAKIGLRLRAKVASGGQEGTALEVAVGLRSGL